MPAAGRFSGVETLAVGDCFWLCGQQNSREHLYVIVNGPDGQGKMIAFNLSKLYPAREGHCQDMSCVVQPGAHPRVTIPSIVKYNWAIVLTEEELQDKVEWGLARRAERATLALAKRILAGALVTEALQRKFYRYVNRPLPPI